jgi:hypothetical protein
VGGAAAVPASKLTSTTRQWVLFLYSSLFSFALIIIQMDLGDGT